MNARRLKRELRRMAQQEVPDSPDLWPAIRARLASRHGAASSSRAHEHTSARPTAVYVWHADDRRSRLGIGTRLLAVAAMLVLVTVGLAVMLGNHGGGGDQQLASTGATPSGESQLNDAAQPTATPPETMSVTPETAQSATESIPSSCPVTLPPATFAPPTPIPGDAGSLAYFTYGTDDLWTKLPVTGNWTGLPLELGQGYVQKIFWLSSDYLGPQMPDLAVTGRRLDAPAPPLVVSQVTNADAPGLGPSMLVGVQFPTLGCWKITGSFKGHSLSFVIWVSQFAVPNPTPAPPVAVTPIASIPQERQVIRRIIADTSNGLELVRLRMKIADQTNTLSRDWERVANLRAG